MARLDWTQLPPALRARVEEFAGSPVAWTQSQDGGFSAGLASRLTFADGRRLFVKAVQESAEGTFALYVREAEVLGALPRSLPAAHLVDAFTAGGWAVLLIEDVARSLSEVTPYESAGYRRNRRRHPRAR